MIDLQYHIEFTTKERRDFLKNNLVKQKLENIFQNIAKEQNVIIKKIAILPEHVHMLVTGTQDFQLKKFMQLIKGKSSYLLKKECPELKDIATKGLWSKTYFARTIGPVSSWKITEYISKQK